MDVIEFADRRVGSGQPVFVIAEIGLNHNGDEDIAARLVRAAGEAGADAVKFQKRDSRALLTRSAYDAPYDTPNAFGATYGEHREALELSVDALARMRTLAEELGMVFLLSVWDLPSVEVGEELKSVVYKVASADLTNVPLLRRLASTGKPLIVSTGMATPEEIAIAVATIRESHDQLILLHCVSTYPAEFDEINLHQLTWLREEFHCPVGYSGHERGIAVSAAAVALGACVVERHFTLDRTMKGPDHAASLEPPGLTRLVRDVRAIEAAMGTRERVIGEREAAVRRKLAKSLVTARALDAGTIVTADDLVAKSPGTGIPPYAVDRVVGRRLKRALDVDEVLDDADLEPA